MTLPPELERAIWARLSTGWSGTALRRPDASGSPGRSPRFSPLVEMGSVLSKPAIEDDLLTRFAKAPTLPPQRIEFVVGVPLRACGLFAPMSATVTTSNVFLLRDRLQVAGANAHAVAANVIELEPRRDRPCFKLIGESVRQCHLPSEPIPPVSASGGGGPHPTAIRPVNLRPKPTELSCRSLFKHAESPSVCHAPGRSRVAGVLRPFYLERMGGGR